MRRHRVLALASDNGSMQAILPVIKALNKDKKIEVTTAAKEVSRDLLAKHRLSALYYDPEEFEADPGGLVRSLFDQCRPDLIFAGSSPAKGKLPETFEQYAIMISRKLSLTSVSVLDFWGMYRERFVLSGERVSLELVPDTLCVLDKECRNDLLKLGVLEENIRITHNPWMDKIAKEAELPPDPSKLTAGVSGICILYVSQPLAEMRPHRPCSYDQMGVLSFLVDSLPKIHDKRHRILVWRHPGEKTGRWQKLPSYSRSDVDIVLTDERGAQITAHVDVVASSHSTVGYEALYYGTPVISLRPVGNRQDPMYTDNLGLSSLFTTEHELSNFLNKFNPHKKRQELMALKNQLLVQNKFFSDGKATERVSAIVRQKLEKEKTL